MISTLRRGAASAAVSLVLAVGAASGAAANPADASPASAIRAGTSVSLPMWRPSPTGTTSTLYVVRVVNRSTVWAVGGGAALGKGDGVVVRTVDAGRHWQNVTPPGGATQVFRDVEAFDRNHALVLTVGPGEAGRVYRTADGGRTWDTVFVNPDPRAFYDCMAFFDSRHGLAVSDPVDGKFRIVTTRDGGRTWQVAPSSAMPSALRDEYANASGTCLIANHGQDAWFGTTVAEGHARVFHSPDRGKTWTVSVTPIPGTPQGIVSMSFLRDGHALAVGGDPPPQFGGNNIGVAARTADAGVTWSLAGALSGYRNGVAWIPGIRRAAVAVGPTGSDISTNAGRTWRSFDGPELYGVDCLRRRCWAVGADGVAAQLVFATSRQDHDF